MSKEINISFPSSSSSYVAPGLRAISDSVKEVNRALMLENPSECLEMSACENKSTAPRKELGITLRV